MQQNFLAEILQVGGKMKLTESELRKIIRETIKKVGNKYIVYPKKGGKRLGTHSTRKSAKKQLAAIEISK